MLRKIRIRLREAKYGDGEVILRHLTATGEMERIRVLCLEWIKLRDMNPIIQGELCNLNSY